MTDEEFNPWKELAEHGLTRPDQVEDCKDWLAVRQLHMDQLKKNWEVHIPFRTPEINLWHLELLETGQFRLDIAKWELEQFIQSLENPN